MESLRDSIPQSHPYTTDYHMADTRNYSTASSTALQRNGSVFAAGKYKPVSQILPEDPVLPSDNPNVKSLLEHKHDTAISSIESTNEPTSSICTWSIGWRTPCLMLLPYIFALLTALAHIGFCLWLRGKGTERIQQTYVTTASIIMANVVGLLLRVSLGCVFTQYLWRLLRDNSLRTSTIEDLFTMRSNVLALGRACGRREAWILLLNALFLWSIPITVSFPPGAITIVQGHELSGLDVLTFANFDKLLENPSLENIDNADISGLFQIQDSEHPGGVWVGQPLAWSNEDDKIARKKAATVALAQDTMMTARVMDFPSPCGPNCRYNFEFNGPYLDCSNTTLNKLEAVDIESYHDHVYTASWINIADDVNNVSASTMARLEIAYLELLSVNNETGPDRKMNVTQRTLSCTPSRARYKVKNAYKDNIETIEVHTVYDRPLLDLEQKLYWPKDTAPFNDSDKAHRIEYVEDANIMSITQGFGMAINGTVAAITNLTSNDNGPMIDHVDRNGTIWFEGRFFVDGLNSETTSMVLFSSLATSFSPSNWSSSGNRFVLTSNPFDITQDKLNALLVNTTLSSVPILAMWTTNVEADRNLTTTEYAFSRPLNIAVPYGLLLGLALPFLVLGMWALYTNGVAAQDGGFFQILMTTRGSGMIDRVARGGCLGGDENVPKALKKLEVRFGTFRDRNDPAGISLAGFGTENEVTAIQKRKAYGAQS